MVGTTASADEETKRTKRQEKNEGKRRAERRNKNEKNRDETPMQACLDLKKGARASKWTNFIQSGGPPGTPQIMARGKIFSN